MSPEAQRSAIAQACGWELKWQNMGGGPLYDEKPPKHCWPVWLPPAGWRQTTAGKQAAVDCESEIAPPDYLNDLNAMHEAEKEVIKQGKWGAFNYHLEHILYREKTACFDTARFLRAHATAAQRAETFLKTISTWKGGA